MLDTRLPASAAGVETLATFGPTSVQLLAPQIAFEVVRSQACALDRPVAVEVRWPGPPANDDQLVDRNDAA